MQNPDENENIYIVEGIGCTEYDENDIENLNIKRDWWGDIFKLSYGIIGI